MRLPAGTLSALSCLSMICLICCAHSPASAGEAIRINGSGSALEVMKPLIKAYTKRHPGVRIEMEKPLGSSGAVKALMEGAIDIAISGKPIRPEDAVKGARSHDYGRIPLAIVTAKNVTKKDITTRELEEIYAGVTRRWPDGKTIRVVLRPLEDVDTAILRGLSPGMQQALATAQTMPGMIVAPTDPESNEMVAGTPGGIGTSGLSGVIGGMHELNVLSLNGVKPGTDTLANGSYPLAKDLRFVTTDRLPVAGRKFLDFVYSPEGCAIAGKSGVLVISNGRAK